MSETPRNDCGDCLAFVADADAAVGVCRRYAPVPAAGAEARAIWPRVRAEDWCLEHRQSVAPFNLTFVLSAEAGRDGA